MIRPEFVVPVPATKALLPVAVLLAVPVTDRIITYLSFDDPEHGAFIDFSRLESTIGNQFCPNEFTTSDEAVRQNSNCDADVIVPVTTLKISDSSCELETDVVNVSLAYPIKLFRN